ncbi:chemotaxis protein CheW [Pullulanibacillus camelliae]|uniref:Chemotaxis protein CheW n=1 Tax=Pullulanibacillus camelliae TaxID=1707096 RepID=A0A8J2YJ13_9BACL|nr:chemotaxis protein CheW [Pullulanibacillus camelliae]GGE46354.1 chemotaxis protein CheW [Pullulanibacillus camelliae]
MAEVNKYMVFSLKNEVYGAPVEQVISVEKPMNITRVPNTAPFIKGVINLRGMILPVIDLLSKFDIGTSDITESTRLAIVQSEDIRVALLIDTAKDVLDITQDDVDPVPEVAGGIHAKYLNGVAKLEEGLMILLNLDKILDPNDIEIIKQLEV